MRCSSALYVDGPAPPEHSNINGQNVALSTSDIFCSHVGESSFRTLEGMFHNEFFIARAQ